MGAKTNLVFQITDENALERLQTDVEQHGAMLVPLGTAAPPQQFSEAEVLLKNFETKTIGKLVGQVVQVSELGEVVVMLSAVSKDALTQLQLEKNTAHSIFPGGLDPSKPLWAQYEAMSRTEKIKLARQGNAEGRRMILKDRDQMLHKMVLNNPGLSVKELVSIVRNNQASAVMLKSIMERSEWMGNISLMEALVFNPLTPTDKAVKLVPKISIDAARRIVKTGSAKEPVKRAARLRVHSRGR
jgi:hypothetical protein